MTTAQILHRLWQKNPKLDYSEVQYVSMRKPITVICPVHGRFECRPMDFLSSRWGCPKCGVEARGSIGMDKNGWSVTHSLDIEVRRDMYVHNKSVVKVRCAKHGWYESTWKEYSQGKRCLMCSTNAWGALHENDQEVKTEMYVHRRSPVSVRCKMHGWYKVTWINYRKGVRCPSCQLGWR